MFSVKIDKEETVAVLKDIIRDKHPRAFGDVDVTSLKLWKISISCDKDEEVRNLTLQENDELLAFRDIGYYWNEEILKDHIHVFIACDFISSGKIIPYIYLNCLVPGDGYDGIFQIKISTEELVNSLKFMVGKKLRLPSNRFALAKLTQENMKTYQIIEELQNSTNAIRTERMDQLAEIFRYFDGDTNTHSSYLNKIIIRLL